MMDAVESLTEDQLLDLMLEIYTLGMADRGNLTVGDRLSKIRIRAEEWLEI